MLATTRRLVAKVSSKDVYARWVAISFDQGVHPEDEIERFNACVRERAEKGNAFSESEIKECFIDALDPLQYSVMRDRYRRKADQATITIEDLQEEACETFSRTPKPPTPTPHPSYVASPHAHGYHNATTDDAVSQLRADVSALTKLVKTLANAKTPIVDRKDNYTRGHGGRQQRYRLGADNDKRDEHIPNMSFCRKSGNFIAKCDKCSTKRGKLFFH